jgi:DNA-binding LacI/PurR family transcriptional regulator
MPSVRDIAKRASVSITTVSRVLNNHPHVSPDVRGRVLAEANRSHYVATVGRRSTNNIGFVYSGDRTLGSPFDAGLFEGIGDALEDFDYDLLILETRRACRAGETYSDMFLRKGVRGAILRATAQSRAICEAIVAEGFPAVVIGERFRSGSVPFIYTDTRKTSAEAIDYLLGLGHRRIAICINTVDDSDHMDRLHGYRDALESRGIEPDPRLIWRVPAHRDGGPQAIKRVLAASHPPTALYITDPLVCVGALVEARRMGISVPEDLSIVGFDDGDLRNCVIPRMTAVCQDASALGREAFLMLNRFMNHERNPSAFRVPQSWFEIHATTAPPKKDPVTAGRMPAVSDPSVTAEAAPNRAAESAAMLEER